MREKHIQDIRAFNRFYTGIIGLLDKYVYHSRYSLPEVRVLYELYNGNNLTATDIISTLGMDKGYLSRILQQFEKKKLVTKKRSEQDGRAVYIGLTSAGKTEFEALNTAADDQISTILKALTDKECERLIQNMVEIKQVLSKTVQKG